MFLGGMQKKEKEVFWNLAVQMVYMDGTVTQEEKTMLEGYNDELADIDKIIEKPEKTLGEYLAGCDVESPSVRKAIYLELFAIAFVDNNYSEEEMQMMRRIKEKFNITDSDASDLEKAGKMVLDGYNLAIAVIGK